MTKSNDSAAVTVDEIIEGPRPGPDDLTVHIVAKGPTHMNVQVIDKKTGKWIRGVRRIELSPIDCDSLITARLDVELWDGLDVETELSALRIVDQRNRLRQLGSKDQIRADEDARAPIIDEAYRDIWSLLRDGQVQQRGSPNGLVDMSIEESFRCELERLAERLILQDRNAR